MGQWVEHRILGGWRNGLRAAVIDSSLTWRQWASIACVREKIQADIAELDLHVVKL